MTDYVTPTTWEQCAAHVEAGGIVEVFDGFDEWLDEGVGPSGFRSRPRGPGIGTWEAPRRLVPIETEAYRKERRAIDVPDGYEAVWLPSETVDEFGAGEDDRVSRGHVVAGAREAQARRGTTPSSAAPDHESSTGNGEGEALADVDQVHTQAGEGSGSPADPLRERIARAIYADDVENERTDFREGVAPCYYDNADAVLAVLPAPPIDEGAGPSGPPWYLAQDVWMALGGTPDAFEAWAHCEDDRRTWGDAWAQIIAAVGGSRMEGDTNPPPGTILDLPSYQWVRESPTPPPAPSWPDGVLRDAANRLRWIANSGYIEDPGIKRIIRSWADELDATLVPPWPGAVLSGLTDEDGVPTWLAQAGQVRGGMVRCSRNLSWVKNNGGHGPGVWVEVRAPRAVPEPETERVPWWEANDRELVDGLLCVENAMIREVGREGDRVYVCGYEDPDNPDEDDRGDWKRNYWFGRDGFDGTVEVLKDGDR